MSKRWQKVELNYLEKHASDKSLEELATRFHTDVATVEAKLKELRLDPATSGSVAASEQQALEAFEEAVKAMYAEQWAKAEKAFERVIEGSRQSELVARARMLAEAARQRQADQEPQDPYLLAVFEKNRGELDAAMALCTEGKRHEKEARFAYLAAAVATSKEELEDGARHLRRAIELEARSRVHALHDPDFEPLRSAAEHADLFADPAPVGG